MNGIAVVMSGESAVERCTPKQWGGGSLREGGFGDRSAAGADRQVAAQTQTEAAIAACIIACYGQSGALTTDGFEASVDGSNGIITIQRTHISNRLVQHPFPQGGGKSFPERVHLGLLCRATR